MAWARNSSRRRWRRRAATHSLSRGWRKASRCGRCCPKARIFVLDGAPADAVPALIAHRLTPVLNSLAEIAGLMARAQSAPHAGCRDPYRHRHEPAGPDRRRNCRCWRRNGARGCRNINLVLLMSHLACGDEPKNDNERRAAGALPRRAGDAAARARQPGGFRRRLSWARLSFRSGAAGHRALWRRPAGRRAKTPCRPRRC